MIHDLQTNMKLLAPTDGKKSWNFEPIKGPGQEANPPFLTGSKVEDEKQQKWGFEEEKRWQTFVHGKEYQQQRIGETKPVNHISLTIEIKTYSSL